MAANTKVWLTPVANYSPNPATPQCSSNSNLTFGFCNADSKTDNFKVKTDSAAYVTVCKFNDIDNDGVQDANEPLIPHWPVTATGVDNGTVNSMTGDNGCVTFIYSGTGSTNVTLTEGSLGPDWTQTAPTSASEPFAVNNFVISVTLNPGDDLQAPNFGNNNLFCAEACDFDGLVVTKDAYPSLTRTFAWDIEKLVDQTEIKTSATSATFNYTVKVTHDAGTDSGWKVTGKIVVANPSGLDITGIDVTDAIDNESCQVDGGDNVTIAAGDHEDFDTPARLPRLRQLARTRRPRRGAEAPRRSVKPTTTLPTRRSPRWTTASR